MINFNLRDFNIARIKRESKLGNLETRQEFRVYGLKNESNPPILINFDEHYAHFDDCWRVQDFLRGNNIQCEIEYEDNSDENVQDRPLISIGLRKDLREQVVLCAAILQTIIYSAENRLIFRALKVPGIPKFANND
jgi:hypothetical protein